MVVDASGEVFGDAPNVAARVQSAAEPGALWVTAGVQRQVAGLFVAEDKGPHELKGVAGKPVLYRLVRASGAGRRAAGRTLTPLVGRAEELAQLARRWERARCGEGQFVQIVGEPGLGKSRLIEEFRVTLAETPHTWVEWSSSQLLQNTPLHPIAEWGRQRFGGGDVAVDKRLAELETALAQVKLDPAENAPLLAPLLDMPVPEDRAPKLAPEELRRRRLAAIAAWVLAGARQQAIVLAFEDLHWADPTTLDLMKTLGERGAQAPLLIVATTRPEFRAPWATRSHHSVISLSPLGRAEIAKMVGMIAAQHALAKDVVEGLSDRTAGVPLFVEELTRLMLEGGAQTIPPTLQQSLAARLDRLGDAREVAQIGAVLGREFSFALLQAVADRSAPALDAALEKLADADLLFVEGTAPAATYRFKHALIQDAAYESLLKGRRQALHRRAAEVLAADPDPQPELVAHHYRQSSQTELAIEWWGKAGDAALRRSAFQEAIAHLGKAIEMADALEAVSAMPQHTRAISEYQAKLHSGYGLAMAWSRGFTAEETKVALARTEQLAALSKNVADRMQSHYARWVQLCISANLASSQETSEIFLREALLAKEPPSIAAAKRALGLTCFYQGRFTAARNNLTDAIGRCGKDWEASARYLYGADTEISAKAFLALTFYCAGEATAASCLFGDASNAALASNHAATIATTFVYKAICEALRDDAEAAQRAASVALNVSEQSGLRYFASAARMYLYWALAKKGGRDELLRFSEHGVTFTSQGGPVMGPLFHSLAAALETKQALFERAASSISRAAELAATHGARCVDALLCRLRGNLLLEANPRDPADAEAAYREAIRISREQIARTFELQGALSLARLLQSTKRSVEARDVLASALEGFTPTPELPAIGEAQKLLAALVEGGDVETA